MDERLVDFLLRAKRATYAGHGAEVAASRPAAHDLRYAEGDLLYYDTYLGSASFAGEEAVWQGGVPIWAMNYVGRVIGPGFEGDFLKAALAAAPRERPFRGPANFQVGRLRYACDVAGDAGWFVGQEEIFKDDVKIYECRFHGGDIRQNTD